MGADDAECRPDYAAAIQVAAGSDGARSGRCKTRCCNTDSTTIDGMAGRKPSSVSGKYLSPEEWEQTINRKNVIVIDYNGLILESNLWKTTLLKNNDSLEIVAMAGGG